MSTFKKVLSIAVRVILWIIILVAALFAFTTLATRDSNNLSSIAGYTPMTVLSDSMSPTFNAGDLIIIKKIEPAEISNLKVGDIITFHTIIENEYALNTHRIVEIENPGSSPRFITKGDNNSIEDQRNVIVGDVVGKYVSRIPLMGHVMQFLSSSIGFLLVIVLPLLIFFIYQVYHLVMVSIQLKKATAAEAALEAAEAAAATDEKAQAAEAARKEAEAALEEARRLKAEAEAALAKAKAAASDATDAAAETAEAAAETVADAAEEIGDASDAK